MWPLNSSTSVKAAMLNTVKWWPTPLKRCRAEPALAMIPARMSIEAARL